MSLSKKIIIATLSIAIIFIVVGALSTLRLETNDIVINEDEHLYKESEATLDTLDFQVFEPDMPLNVVIDKDWSVVTDSIGRREIIREYRVHDDVLQEQSGFVRINQRQVQDRDIELLSLDIGEHYGYAHEAVDINGNKALLIRALHDLPHKKTDYDPRKAPRLAMIIDDTYILFWSENEAFFSPNDLIQAASSLKPLSEI